MSTLNATASDQGSDTSGGGDGFEGFNLSEEMTSMGGGSSGTPSSAAPPKAADSPQETGETMSDGNIGDQVPQPEQGELPLNDPGAPQGKKLPAKRDFTGLDEEEAKLFKNMNNEAYQRLYPIYLNSKKENDSLKVLQEKLDAADKRRWYDEPEAYTLHPEYKQAQASVSRLTNELSFWEEQLAEIEEGREGQTYTLDSKGDYVPGPKVSGGAGKAHFISLIAHTRNLLNQESHKSEALKSSFATKYKSFDSELEKADKDFFGKLDINHPSVKSRYEYFQNRFPAEYRNQRPYQMLAKGLTIIEEMLRRQKDQEATKVVKTQVAATAKNNGPGEGLAGAKAPKSLDALDREYEKMTGRPSLRF